MISIAYQLRPVAAPDGLKSHIRRIRDSVCFLGRLRSAYEAFKETAIELQKSFKTLTISCLPPPDARWLKKSELIQRVQELVKMEQVPQPQKRHLDKLQALPIDLLTTCHAEVQLLLKFKCSYPSNIDPFHTSGAVEGHVGYATSSLLTTRTRERILEDTTKHAVLMARYTHFGISHKAAIQVLILAFNSTYLLFSKIPKP